MDAVAEGDAQWLSANFLEPWLPRRARGYVHPAVVPADYAVVTDAPALGVRAQLGWRSATYPPAERLRLQGAAILEATRATRQLHLQSANLFTTRRHQVYARLYKLLRIGERCTRTARRRHPVRTRSIEMDASRNREAYD